MDSVSFLQWHSVLLKVRINPQKRTGFLSGSLKSCSKRTSDHLLVSEGKPQGPDPRRKHTGVRQSSFCGWIIPPLALVEDKRANWPGTPLQTTNLWMSLVFCFFFCVCFLVLALLTKKFALHCFRTDRSQKVQTSGKFLRCSYTPGSPQSSRPGKPCTLAAPVFWAANRRPENFQPKTFRMGHIFRGRVERT